MYLAGHKKLNVIATESSFLSTGNHKSHYLPQHTESLKQRDTLPIRYYDKKRDYVGGHAGGQL